MKSVTSSKGISTANRQGHETGVGHGYEKSVKASVAKPASDTLSLRSLNPKKRQPYLGHNSPSSDCRQPLRPFFTVSSHDTHLLQPHRNNGSRDISPQRKDPLPPLPQLCLLNP